MTPLPYELNGERKNGRFVGVLVYGKDEIAHSADSEPDGFKSEKDLQAWARAEGYKHKVSISPAETYLIQSTFVL